MENQIKTSIQYQFSNVRLFYEMVINWYEFNEALSQGPDAMKKYLYDLWNMTKEKLMNNKNFQIQDIEKEVTINDFDITYNKTKNGTGIFYFTLPDYEYRDAASKYVAIALTKEYPRYFTLEYSEHVVSKEPCWVVGEFYMDKNKKLHRNLGTVDNMRLSWFSGFIMGMLEQEGQ